MNFDRFVEKLKEQYTKESKLFTEDLIRYWFVNSMELYKDAIIELPYSKSPLKIKEGKNILKGNRYRVDLYIKNKDAAIEFKYHRKSTSVSPCYTSKRAAVFCDLNRLSLLDNERKYLIYAFDEDMKRDFDGTIPKLLCKDKILFPKDITIKSNYFREIAFRCFNCGEEQFNYCVEKEFSDWVIENKLYLLILKVLNI